MLEMIPMGHRNKQKFAYFSYLLKLEELFNFALEGVYEVLV